MSKLQWHSCNSKMFPKDQNHRKHCAQWCISLVLLYFLMSASDKSQWHTGFKHLQPNESKSHQYLKFTMAQLQQEDTLKRPKSQKTLRTVAHQSAFSLFLMSGFEGFQSLSAQWKHITPGVRITSGGLKSHQSVGSHTSYWHSLNHGKSCQAE